MLKKIYLLIPSKSQYLALHSFTISLYQSLQKLGYECKLLDLSTLKFSDLFRILLTEEPDLTISFNGLLPNQDGTFLSDTLKIPHLAILVDPINQFFPLLKSNYTIIATVDQKLCKEIESFGFKNIFFLPHAIDSKYLSNNIPAKKTIDIAWFGTCLDPNPILLNWNKIFEPSLVKLLLDAADLCLKTDYSLNESFSHFFCKLSTDEQKSIQSNAPIDILLTELELYIKAKDRSFLLNALDDFKIEIFGSAWRENHWDKMLNNPHLFKIHGAMPYEETIKKMSNCKIILNSAPVIKDGLHERILNSLSQKAIVITNKNTFVKKLFKDNKEVVTYQFGNKESLRKKIKSILNENDFNWNFVHQKLLDHTFDQRAKAISENIGKFLNKISQNL